jgi:hypothetical protein
MSMMGGLRAWSFCADAGAATDTVKSSASSARVVEVDVLDMISSLR